MNNLMRVDPLHELEEMNQRLGRFFGANDLAPFWRGEREDVSAEFKDGMLYVRMGKSEKAKPRSIEVKVG